MNDTITIVGTIGTDPERKVRGGVPITTFRVASKERRFDKASGAWVDGETNWYTASAYRRLADHVYESLHRRERVILTGRLKVRNWDTGEKRGTSVDIDIDAIGHDLLFGTTAFRSDDARSDESGSAAAPAEEWATTSSDGGWDVVEQSTSSSASPALPSPAVEPAQPREPELVAAETPF